MKLIIHDLPKQVADTVLPRFGNDVKTVTAEGKLLHCIGCFDCWVKTPMTCVLKDDYREMGRWLGLCDELILISQCRYGGFSPNVKNILDRSIGYMLPYFVKRNGELHHASRFTRQIILSAHFYGADLTEAEKDLARELVTANGLNFNTQEDRVTFYSSPERIGTLS